MKTTDRVTTLGICVGLGLAVLAFDARASTVMVTNNADAGPGTLRQAIADAQTNDMITFATALTGSVITLTSGEIVPTKPLTIAGPGAGLLAINGGGGVYALTSAGLSLFNCTVVGNGATKRGGGIRNNGSTNLYLHSTLVAGNTDTAGFPDVCGPGTFFGLTNCLVQITNGVALPGANNIFGQDPLVSPLAGNGGFTRTHALKKNSPAIDKGANPANLVFDQRGAGFPRQMGLAVDIGAYELWPPPRGTLVSVR